MISLTLNQVRDERFNGGPLFLSICLISPFWIEDQVFFDLTEFRMLHARNLDNATFMDHGLWERLIYASKNDVIIGYIGVPHTAKLVEHVSPHGNLSVCLSYKFNWTIPDVYCRNK